MDQTNSGILCSVMPGARMLRMVVMKLAAPRIELAPARWSEKIAISTAAPGCPAMLESGGYTVQPVPAPPPTTAESTSSKSEGIKSQKEILFRRGKAISGAPIINGMNQLPKPPIRPGMTTKNTMIRP